jgi:cell division protein FtsA
MRGTIQNKIAAIDLGSNKIACLLGKLDENMQIQILAKSIHFSNGLRAGSIVDFSKTKEAILNAIFSVEKEYGSNIRQVAVTLSGGDTRSHIIETSKDLANPRVSGEDIKSLMQIALNEVSSRQREILHYFPLEYSLDNNHHIDDPVGMYGNKLSCKVHVITADSMNLLNIAGCFAGCQVEVSGFSSAIYNDADALLSENDKQVGCLLIDFGARTTSFAVYYNNTLYYTYYLPIGSEHVTLDIAKVCSISYSEAERMKILHGTVNLKTIDYNKQIPLPSRDELGEAETIDKAELSEIIYMRIEEIIDLLKAKYDTLNMDHLIARSIVLTGGGSSLEGLDLVLAKKFGKKIHRARPNHGANLETAYAAASGLVKREANKLEDYYNKSRGVKLRLNNIFAWLRSYFR